MHQLIQKRIVLPQPYYEALVVSSVYTCTYSSLDADDVVFELEDLFGGVRLRHDELGAVRGGWSSRRRPVDIHRVMSSTVTTMF